MVIEHIEPDIKFSFKKESVIKYDDTKIHEECKHTSKKGVDFVYKYGSKLMLIEVKDFDRNIDKKTEFQQKQILKATYKTLELNSINPFEGFVNKIIQKVNDTLLDVFSSSILQNKQELKKLTSKIKELIFVVIIDLPQDMKEYLNAISDKLTQYFKKYSCIFDTNVVVIDSTSKLSSFTMQKI
jgi:dGTP triphosphohydrolase